MAGRLPGMINAPVSPGQPLTTALGGLQNGVARLNRAAETVAAGNVGVAPMVDAMLAEQTVKQNAAVIRAADAMHGTLIDILA